MLYRYVKALPEPRRHLRFIAFGLTGIGLVMLANVGLPLFVYRLQTQSLSPQIISPLGQTKAVLGADSIRIEQWFPSVPALPSWQSKITDYNLSIPKLGIKQALVKINSEDLSQSLVHYAGTTLPGQYGNAIIFGHSILPQFFNPKKYKTIFSTLPTLQEGDEILVDFDGITYRYQVINMVEVSPQDVSVLEQHYDAEYLSLITCVPPGTYLHRLVVKAKLVRF